MRLADEIVLAHITPMRPNEKTMAMTKTIRESLMGGAPVFKVSNVAEYLYSRKDKSFLEVCPVLRPPFEEVWAEWNAPTELRDLGFERFGALTAYNPSENSSDGTMEVKILSVVQKCGGAPVFVDVSTHVFIDRLGRHENRIKLLDWKTGTHATAEVAGHIAHMSQPALMAMAFLSCKNVKQVDESVSEKLQKAFIRRHGRPMLKFKTLEIEPMKQVLATEGNIEANGLKKALHICRGHFATYDIKPLFGKVKGTFWVPSCVKGSATNGTICKDYQVKAGKHP